MPRHKLLLTALCIALSGVATPSPAAEAHAIRPTPEDVRQARALAEQGEPDKQTFLGFLYWFGNGVPEDRSEAVKWWKKAAEAGDAIGACELSDVYLRGEGGVPRDTEEGIRWLRKSAEGGYRRCQWMLGKAYEKGKFVPKDMKEAVKWWKKAADQGYMKAIGDLGAAYTSGLGGLEQDYNKALILLRQSAGEGYVGAQYNLGQMYRYGLGVPENAATAVEWWEKAADQGDKPAANDLGDAYANGRGVPHDIVLAYMWYAVASRGDESAAIHKTLLERAMTAAEIKRAKELQHQWAVDHYLKLKQQLDSVNAITTPNK